MFDIKLEGIEAALKRFDFKKVITAARQAINRTADSIRTEASRFIRTKYNIKATKLNQYLKVGAKANGNSLSPTISGKGLALALSYFYTKQSGVMTKNLRIGSSKIRSLVTKGSRRYGRAVTALVGPREAARFSRINMIINHILTQMKTGHLGVFVRTGKGKRPIEQIIGPGVGGLFDSKRIMDRNNITVINKFRLFITDTKGAIDHYLRKNKMLEIWKSVKYWQNNRG
jgi:hypothetical protein